MPGLVFHVAAVATCPHGGQVQTVSANARVLVSGLQVATMVDQSTVIGCAFNVSGAPSPCVKIQWTVPSARVKVMGQPVLLQASVGLCQNPAQAPQGPAIIATVQPRVTAL
jgi:hypothetical protein